MVPIGTVTYSAGNSKELILNGLDTEQEVRTIRILLMATLLSTAAAFAWAMADYSTLANKLVGAKVRITMDQDENSESLSPVEWRSDAIDATGRDPWQEFLHVGDSIPVSTGAALTVKLPVDINYIHEALETSNLLTISSDQINAGAAKVAIDWNAAPGNVVFANGTATVTPLDAKVQMDWFDAHMVFVGPHWSRKSKGATAAFDLEEFPSIELLLAQESSPAVFEASVSQVSVNRDDKLRPRNIPPTELAAMYNKHKVKVNGDQSGILDLTNPNNGLGGGQGSVLSPIIYPNGRVRAAEYELPFYMRKRRVEFPSGTSFAYQFLRKATVHISRQADLIAAIMGKAQVGGRPQDLRVRGFGGGDNDTLAQFKGRVVKFTGS